MAQSMHPAGMPLKVFTECHNVLKQTKRRSMNTFLGFEVSYAPWKYKIISYIQVHLVAVLNWCLLVDSVIVAPPGGCFFVQFHKPLPRLRIVILSE